MRGGRSEASLGKEGMTTSLRKRLRTLDVVDGASGERWDPEGSRISYSSGGHRIFVMGYDADKHLLERFSGASTGGAAARWLIPS